MIKILFFVFFILVFSFGKSYANRKSYTNPLIDTKILKFFKMDVISETKNTLLYIKKHILTISRAIDENIFSEDIDKMMREVEESIRSIPKMVSEIIERSKREKIPYDEISEIINLFSDIEAEFIRFIAKLESISSADAKRLESINMISSQIKKAKESVLKGRNIKLKG